VTSELPREGDLRCDMAKHESALSSESMASSVVLKAAKKELRTLMKQKLSSISTDAVNTQSRLLFPLSPKILH
jgi:hypothetical protein